MAVRTMGWANSSIDPGASTSAARSRSASCAAWGRSWPASAAACRSGAGPPRTASARVSRPAPSPSWATRRSTACATGRGPTSAPPSPSRSAVASDSSRNGFPPVLTWHAWHRPASARAPSRLRYQRGRRVIAKRPEPQPDGLWAGTQLVEQGRLVRAVAHGEQQRDRQALDAGGQVREPAQRRRVGPVRVVHGDHQRAPGGEVRDQPVEAVHGRVRDVVFDRAGLGRVEDAGGQPGRAVKQPIPSAATRTGSSSWRTMP